jgi:hypothetical protein
VIEAVERFFVTAYRRRSQPAERVERDMEAAL